jgi:hypothetical protein
MTAHAATLTFTNRTIVPPKKSSGFWVLMLSVRDDWPLSQLGPRLSGRLGGLELISFRALIADRVN